MNLANNFFFKASTGRPDERGIDLLLLQTLLVTEPSEFVLGGKRDELVHKLCSGTPSLPVVILNDLEDYKDRQYSLGRENTEVGPHIRLRYSFFMSVLHAERVAGGDFHFTQEILENFWSKVLTSGKPGTSGLDEQFWGGDYITECMRDILFEFIWKYDVRSHAGLVNLLFITTDCRMLGFSGSLLRRSFLELLCIPSDLRVGNSWQRLLSISTTN
jgi:hypothetical protein